MDTTTPAAPVAETARARTALLDALDVTGKDVSERFERIVRTARDVFGVPVSYINLLDGETQHTVTRRLDDPERTIPIEQSFCQFTIEQPGGLVIEDATADPRTSALPMVVDDGVRFYAGIPLTMPGGVRIGSLCLLDTEPRTLDPDALESLGELTRWAERILAEGLEQDRIAAARSAITPAPIELPGWTIDGTTFVVDSVGGDVHDWCVVPGGAVVSIADVSGRGQASSLLAAGLRGALRARAETAPADAVRALEAQVGPELERAGSFAALFHARIDGASGRVDFVDAGHGMVLHLHDGTAEIVRSRDLPIGLQRGPAARRAGTVELASGDALVLVTDGALDLGDGTLDAMFALGNRLAGAPSVPAFLDSVRDRAAGRAEDDVTVVVVARD